MSFRVHLKNFPWRVLLHTERIKMVEEWNNRRSSFSVATRNVENIFNLKLDDKFSITYFQNLNVHHQHQVQTIFALITFFQ